MNNTFKCYRGLSRVYVYCDANLLSMRRQCSVHRESKSRLAAAEAVCWLMRSHTCADNPWSRATGLTANDEEDQDAGNYRDVG